MKNLNKSLLVVGIVALAGYGVSKNVIKETTELDRSNIGKRGSIRTK
ncbi:MULTISPECIES: hypothetical protein [Capnocytophaga]|nr:MULTISPECIES: hypothetical protein [Capnocytophaga]